MLCVSTEYNKRLRMASNKSSIVCCRDNEARYCVLLLEKADTMEKFLLFSQVLHGLGLIRRSTEDSEQRLIISSILTFKSRTVEFPVFILILTYCRRMDGH
jgi:hypothetical protein